MTDLRDLQRAFSGYVLRNEQDIAEHVNGDQGLSGERRLSIYHSAYRMRLRATIESDHPVLCAYLGDELFELLAAEYVAAHPSTSTSLRQFCDQLPHFLQTNESFAAHPVLSELALFERRLLEAFDAAGAERVTATTLSELPAPQWPDMTLSFHPSLIRFVAAMNTVQIWQAMKAEQTPPSVEAAAGTWLIWRNQDRLTQFRSVGDAELAAIECCVQGGSFTHKCAALLPYYDDTEIASAALRLLQDWLANGLVVRLG